MDKSCRFDTEQVYQNKIMDPDLGQSRCSHSIPNPIPIKRLDSLEVYAESLLERSSLQAKIDLSPLYERSCTFVSSEMSIASKKPDCSFNAKVMQHASHSMNSILSDLISTLFLQKSKIINEKKRQNKWPMPASLAWRKELDCLNRNANNIIAMVQSFSMSLIDLIEKNEDKELEDQFVSIKVQWSQMKAKNSLLMMDISDPMEQVYNVFFCATFAIHGSKVSIPKRFYSHFYYKYNVRSFQHEATILSARRQINSIVTTFKATIWKNKIKLIQERKCEDNLRVSVLSYREEFDSLNESIDAILKPIETSVKLLDLMQQDCEAEFIDKFNYVKEEWLQIKAKYDPLMKDILDPMDRIYHVLFYASLAAEESRLPILKAFSIACDYEYNEFFEKDCCLFFKESSHLSSLSVVKKDFVSAEIQLKDTLILEHKEYRIAGFIWGDKEWNQSYGTVLKYALYNNNVAVLQVLFQSMSDEARENLKFLLAHNIYLAENKKEVIYIAITFDSLYVNALELSYVFQK